MSVSPSLGCPYILFGMIRFYLLLSVPCLITSLPNFKSNAMKNADATAPIR